MFHGLAHAGVGVWTSETGRWWIVTSLWELGMVGFLAVENLLLGGFNLLPGFPLDGGRVLRALVWQRNADRLAATRVAARVSHVLAWVLIGLGLLEGKDELRVTPLGEE